MHVLLPDSWHFHRRNFAALFDTLADQRIPWTRERSRRAWWKAHGDYRPFATRLAGHVAALSGLDGDELRHASWREVNLWDVARGEFLCRVICRPHWMAGGLANESAAVLRHALSHPDDRDDLLLCMAAARDWVEFWHDWLAGHPKLTHALAFSGSYIYTRALHEVARSRGLRTFGLETFFTGNEFYLEERHLPLSNQSRLKDAAYHSALSLPPEGRLRDRAAAQRRLAAGRNKNVHAVHRPLPPPWRNGRPTVLVVGQVLNDFSLLETPLPEISSLAVYRRLIGRILAETDCNVIFKAHPWERKRPNLRRPFTLEALQSFAAGLPPERQARLLLTEKESIRTLFGHADHVVGLCSQGLLEACQYGLKPSQIGQAFFGGKGFTHDFPDADAFVDALAAGLPPRLSLDEYDLFEDFLARALLIHLLGPDPHSRVSIAQRLREPDWTPCHDPRRTDWALAPQPLHLMPLLREMAGNPIPWLRDGVSLLARRP